MDQPDGRKAHETPMPRIGGVSVFLGFIAGMTFAAYATGNLFVVPQGVYWRGLAIAATLMFLVGLVDDLKGLSYRWKFAAQIAAAGYVWSCGFRIELITHPLGGAVELGAFSLPLTVLWIVGITNAVNLIDGLDGLAGGIALIMTVTVAAIAFAGGKLGVTAASVALAGSLVGFLYFNFNPARIFLGDSGSMFLGFVLAVTTVRGSQKGTTVVALLVPLLILGLPVLDTTMAVLRRLYRIGNHGRNTNGNSLRYVVQNINQVFLPDRDHIHHRLLDHGMSHRGAVLTLYGVGVLFAGAAFALVWVQSRWIAGLLAAVLTVTLVGFLLMLYLRAVRPRRENPRNACIEDETTAVAEPFTANPSRATSGVTRTGS
jgi:UDP-GlcNAc:undecaprenyl-phosphate GlcNAc-1-phosphate transferase